MSYYLSFLRLEFLVVLGQGGEFEDGELKGSGGGIGYRKDSVLERRYTGVLVTSGEI